MPDGDQTGCDLETGLGNLPDQPDDHVVGLGLGDGVGGDARDTGNLDVLEGYVPVEDGVGEDDHLGGRIVSFDVVGGVGLGVAELLRFLESLLEGLSVVHLAEDVVAGTVEDTADGGNLLPLEVLVAEVDDGHRASDRTLEAELASVLLGECDKVVEVKCQGTLVDGDDVLSALECVPDRLQSGAAGFDVGGGDLDQKVVFD